MPIIQVGEADIKRQQLPRQGWHKCKLLEVKEEQNKNKDGMNYMFTMEITEGVEVEKWCFVRASSKAIGIIAIPFFSALLDIPEDQFSPSDYDTDKLIGKECWVEVKDDVYDGKPQKRCENFASISGGSLV